MHDVKLILYCLILYCIVFCMVNGGVCCVILQAGDGIDTQLIVEAWEAAFESSDPAKGGCPDAPSYL